MNGVQVADALCVIWEQQQYADALTQALDAIRIARELHDDEALRAAELSIASVAHKPNPNL